MSSVADRALIIAIPALAVAQIAAGSLHDLTGIGDSIPARSAASRTAAIPADEAFIIWGAIFLGCLAFSIYQALPSQRDNPVLSRLRGPAAAAFALNALWEVNAQVNDISWPSLAIIVALLAASLAGPLRLAAWDGAIGGRDRWLAAAPIHLLAGWISVATFAHLSSTIRLTGGLGLGLPATPRDALLALSAAGVAALITPRLPVPGPYAGAVTWGLAGIVAANVGRVPNATIATAAACGAALVAGSWLLSGRRRQLRGGTVAAPA